MSGLEVKISCNLFFSAGGGLWPDSEATADGRDGSLLGSTRRRIDAAGRRWLRQPDAGQRFASLVSGIKASSSMPATKFGVAD
jgi:hypothetical protein